jgi:hypothetical protein
MKLTTAASFCLREAGIQKMEDRMADYSESIVFFLMIPVLMQIVLPLLMLAGYGVGQLVKVLIKRPKTDTVSVDTSHPAGEKLASHI